ncbi:LPS-assembly protein LptD [uncultured Brachyspira sp.]|uniref:LPS-assembly protein LptD n=1 Tax=uncultured Brachyspira sp. TaxID=221953 RepID=UPI0025962B35|nr:LPS-assembly protein LptD [uncultured Brachyspira sp.]
MRVLILLLSLIIFNAYLYAQDNNQDNNNIRTNENVLMQINQFDAKRNPVSFINIVNFTPYYVLTEYARNYGIEIYPYDDEASLRARIIKRQVNVDVIKITGEDNIKNVARASINTGGGQIEFKSADYVERYKIEEAGEELIALYGNVQLKVYNNIMSADRVVYSLKTGEIFASGNLKVESGDSVLNGEWFMLNKDDKKGILYNGNTKFQSFTLQGNIIKFNDPDFFANDSSVSFSRLTPVAHDFLASRVYLWDTKKVLIFNSIYRVGRQPVFYFPLFIQNNVGTGIISTFGQSLREGVYMQNSKTFDLYGVSHRIRFDAYQKLGFLIGDEIRYTSQYHNLSLDAMFALGRQYYLLDSYISSSIGFGTRYVNYFTGGKPGKFIPRYKFQYDHTIQLYGGENINAYLTGKLNLNSDLYFKSDFYNQRGALDILSLFTAITGNLSDIGDSYPESYIENSIYVNSSIYGVNLRAGAEWNLTAVRNLSVNYNTNFDYYMPKPSRLVLPSLSASYSSIFGDETSYYFPNFNINYNISMNYSHTIDYKTSEGIAFYNNPKLNEQLNEKLAERNNLQLNGGLSRSFTNLFMRFTPNFNIDYAYQKSINPKSEDLIYDRDNTYLGLASSMNLSVFLPTSILPYKLDNYFSPSVSWDTSYSIGYRFKQKDASYTNENQNGDFSSHSINTSLNVGGTGYSIFFIPNLNWDIRGTVRTGYDLIPTYNAQTKNYELIHNTNRFLTTEVGGSTRLYYDSSYISYDLSKNLLGTNFTQNAINTLIHIPIPIDNLTDWILVRNNKKKFFDGYKNDFRFFFDITYKHDFINYKYNSAAFSLGFELKILEQFTFSFSTTSRNDRAYRYIKSYAERENETWVNPFWDIVDSFNFRDSQKRIDSLFKLSSINTSIWHELDGWQLRATFSISPSALPSDIASGSVKGSYWNKEFWIEFTLTDFPNAGLPRREYDLNSTITDLRDNRTTTTF